MKKLTMLLYISIAIVILAGCGDKSDDEATTDSQKNNPVEESEKGNSTSALEESDTEDENDSSSEESSNTDSTNTTSKNNDANVDTNVTEADLSQYSSEQIEYARVWLQLGPNQELEELYAQLIPAGTPLNPDDETSATYPEDVIQLSGVRLVDGSVTYSGNGDGTINIYNVPLRWDGQYPAGEEFYLDLIENTELVAIDTGDDDKVIELIKLLNIQG